MYSFIKRVIDIFISLFMLIFLFPLILIIIILIKIDSEGNAVYKHKRLGKNGKYFIMYKFRTMYLNENIKDNKLKNEFNKNFKIINDPRITKVGKFLRKYYLDEILQFLNVIKGDMSIVGPRPIVDKEKKLYGKELKKLLSIKPGMTGYWVINGHSNVNYDERKELELFYVKNRSIILDIKIIIKTIHEIIKGSGI